MTEQVQGPAPAPEAPAQEQQKQVALSLVDLKNALKVMDVSIARGTFSSTEISMVAALRIRIEYFLEVTGGLKLPTPMDSLPSQKPEEGALELDSHEPHVPNRIDNPDNN